MNYWLDEHENKMMEDFVNAYARMILRQRIQSIKAEARQLLDDISKGEVCEEENPYPQS